MFDYIKYICNYKYRPLFNYPNVVGVADGYKITRDIKTTTPCVAILVSKKVSYNCLSSEHIIPKSYMGVITDVIETGIFKPLSLTSKQRPMTFGYSIGLNHSSVSEYFGTAGCMVTSKNPKYAGKKYILSCNHVLVNNDSNLVGSDVLQPANKNLQSQPSKPFFSFRKTPPHPNKIATVTSFVPIILKSGSFVPENLVDCAIAELISNDIANSTIEFVKTPTGISVPIKDSTVISVGAASGKRLGKVISTSASVEIPYDDGLAEFINQILVNILCSQGDSGAALLNEKDEVLGILTSGSYKLSCFSPIDEVLRSLNVDLVTIPNRDGVK